MVELTYDDFGSFFSEIYGYNPYPWQNKLAKQVVETGNWPTSINVPTGCGKTSCIDIAVFALACNPENNPRRIIFVVNRRVIVDEGNEHAKKISKCLASPDANSQPTLLKVKNNLCEISGGEIALTHTVLRGGTHMDDEWSTNPIQPVVISSTVDQVGSRLLFRGYGLGSRSKLVNAGILGYDCLWILDETHISKPFTNTLRSIEKFRKHPWIKEPISRPWAVVEMTATPSNVTGKKFELSDEDYTHDEIKIKLEASKPCILVESKSKDSGDYETLASDLQKQALILHKTYHLKAIAIVVNRVATAKQVYQKLKDSSKDDYDTHLVIGRMRPWDRDLLWETNIKLLKTSEPKPTKTVFVVTTQCLEVGADLNFEGMVSEASSLDSLRQRFGRLNRDGKYENSRGSIVAPKSVTKKTGTDPIYGDAVNKTWKFLNEHSKDGIDFGISKFAKIIENYDNLEELAMKDAPTIRLLPSYIDLLCQTHDYLHVDPNIAPFLHGLERGFPMVSIIWRAGWNDTNWNDLMNALPPKSMESIQVPIWNICKYLKDGEDLCSEGDVEWQKVENSQDGKRQKVEKDLDDDKQLPLKRAAGIWRGKHDSNPNVNSVDDIRPGDIIVLHAEDGGWSELGHIPCMEDNLNERMDKLDVIDIAEKVVFKSTEKVIIRMGDNFPVKMNEKGRAFIDARKHEYSKEDVEIIKKEIWESLQKTPLLESLQNIASTINDGMYFTKNTLVHDVELLENNILLIKSWHRPVQQNGKKDDDRLLSDHTDQVVNNVQRYVNRLGLNDFADLFEMTAKVHDIGKADKRFQQMLYRSLMHPSELLAKDNGKKLDKTIVYYPKGFRHEFVSSGLAKTLKTFDNDLFLHLVESHHGHCRPFVPVIFDEKNPNVVYRLKENTLETCASTGIEHVGSGAAKRFWKCVRKYGWWGLAWLEALFILADHEASRGTK